MVIDEFHHAEAASYRRLLDHVQPIELVGLTATPERADGVDVREFFGGGSPRSFDYGTHWSSICCARSITLAFTTESILGDLQWRRGGYDLAA